MHDNPDVHACLQVPTVPVYEYPPTGLGSSTSTTTSMSAYISGQGHGNGVYSVLASSDCNSEYPGASNVAYVFDKNVGDNQDWKSGMAYSQSTGAYTGSVKTEYKLYDESGLSYEGEWIQLHLPYPITIAHYELAPMRFTEVDISTRGPKDFLILGSNTGDSWFLVDNRTGVTGWSSAGTYKQFVVSAVKPYSYYRICISKTQAVSIYTSITALSEWKLFSSTPSQSPTAVSANLLESFWLS
jgi:hypothetical protein